MSKIYYLFFILFFFSTLINAQEANLEFKYFDQNYRPISKQEFEDKTSTNRILNIQGDSIHHRILVNRVFQGELQNRRQIDSLLTKASGNKVDSSKPIFIRYYPGKDRCNSTGSASRRYKKRYYEEEEKRLNKIRKSTILYVYKSDDGLSGKNDAFRTWIKDPDMILEKLFFKRHYPCGSFVVISEKGEFISYFGEAGMNQTLKALQILISR